ncbi:MAG: glycosyltransferase family 39 protein [Bryobacteraceae bacterium]|nr:glycosyltransferase family 39 protein [Bryobacterales bacterium]MEB2361476.1 glycosyltransferase family 39 protein [Bryobacterales bacterium]NUN01580.1 glycosyltransferase family 39 protein [Bryobacteraceae bacterium]
MRREVLIVLAFVLLLRLPFLNQAIQGDDVYYIAAAEHAQIDPLHPGHARFVFLGDEVSMQGHPHPPLNSWVLAILLAALGDIREVGYHSAYILFSLLATFSMWLLARRFSPQPLWATLLFLATPAFVVNGNSLESDVPFLAFWLAAVALFVRAMDRRSGAWLGASAVVMALAAMTAFQAVVLAPILAVYVWLKRRTWMAGWVATLTAPGVIAAWQLYERLTSGALPAAELAGNFRTYNLQNLAAKFNNAVALTAHLGWIVFPLAALLAFGRFRKPWLLVAGAVAIALWLDSHPLFWVSFGTGVVILIGLSHRRSRANADTGFLSAWSLIFFLSALVLFFAGSARYLLPLAAPVALLVSRAVGVRWLAAGFALQAALSLSLALVNYQHWDGYRRFAASLRDQTTNARTWINGEWGLRFYFESDGGLAVRKGQAIRPGEILISSELAYPVPVTTGGGKLTTIAREEIQPSFPFCLIGLGCRSSYSTVSAGNFRPFDIAHRPLDRVRAAVVMERKPTLENLLMSAPEADSHIVSGVFQLEEGRYRWMGGRAIFALKAPAVSSPLRISFFVPSGAPARCMSAYVDGKLAAEITFNGPGSHELISPPVMPEGGTATVTVAVDRTFQPPNDRRELGVILVEAGFQRNISSGR